jgi:hypothetical protein
VRTLHTILTHRFSSLLTAGLFIYIGTSFSPNPMELVGEIEKCFSVNGELQVHYCLQEAWG